MYVAGCRLVIASTRLKSSQRRRGSGRRRGKDNRAVCRLCYGSGGRRAVVGEGDLVSAFYGKSMAGAPEILLKY